MIKPASVGKTAILASEAGGFPAPSARPTLAADSSPFADLVRKQMRSPSGERKVKAQDQPHESRRTAKADDAPAPEARQRDAAMDAPCDPRPTDDVPQPVADAPAADQLDADAPADLCREPDTAPDAPVEVLDVVGEEPTDPAIAPAAGTASRAVAQAHAASSTAARRTDNQSEPTPEASTPTLQHQDTAPTMTTAGTHSGIHAAVTTHPDAATSAPAAAGVGAEFAPAETPPAAPGNEPSATEGAEEALPAPEPDAVPLPLAEAGQPGTPSSRADALPTTSTSPFKLELASTRGPAPAEAQSTNPAAQSESVEAQFSRGLAAVLHQKGGSVTLRLMPEALGQLRVRLEASPGHIAVQFEVGSVAARELLDDSLVRLRASLEARGLTVDRASVVLDPSLKQGDERPSENGPRQWTGTGQDGRQPAQSGDERRQDAPDHRRAARTQDAPGTSPLGAERRTIPTDDSTLEGGAPHVVTARLRLNAVA